MAPLQEGARAIVPGKVGGAGDSSRGRRQLPGCYPREQGGEDLLREDEPGDGHEASSDAPIEHLAPGVVQQVDPGPRTEGSSSEPARDSPAQPPCTPECQLPWTSAHTRETYTDGTGPCDHTDSELLLEGGKGLDPNSCSPDSRSEGMAQVGFAPLLSSP